VEYVCAHRRIGALGQTWFEHAVCAACSMSVLQVLHRSRSAPREEAAARRHIERMNGSPTRAAAVAASRESILDSQQQQMYGSWQRQQQLRQSGGNVRGSAAFASPSARKVCLSACPAVRPPRTQIRPMGRASVSLPSSQWQLAAAAIAVPFQRKA
jgi:hypothetical protein